MKHVPGYNPSPQPSHQILSYCNPLPRQQEAPPFLSALPLSLFSSCVPFHFTAPGQDPPRLGASPPAPSREDCPTAPQDLTTSDCGVCGPYLHVEGGNRLLLGDRDMGVTLVAHLREDPRTEYVSPLPDGEPVLVGTGEGLGGVMPVGISRGTERSKAPKVILVCLLKIQEPEEQSAPEEAGTVARGVSPQLVDEECSESRRPAAGAQWAKCGRGSDFYQGEETMGSHCRARRSCSEATERELCGSPQMEALSSGPRPPPSHPLLVFPIGQADGNCPVEVHLRSDPDDARAMTWPAGVAPRGSQPWSSHRRKPLRSGKRRRKKKWQRPKEPHSSMEDQSTRFLPAVVQVRRVGGDTARRPWPGGAGKPAAAQPRWSAEQRRGQGLEPGSLGSHRLGRSSAAVPRAARPLPSVKQAGLVGDVMGLYVGFCENDLN